MFFNRIQPTVTGSVRNFLNSCSGKRIGFGLAVSTVLALAVSYFSRMPTESDFSALASPSSFHSSNYLIDMIPSIHSRAKTILENFIFRDRTGIQELDSQKKNELWDEERISAVQALGLTPFPPLPKSHPLLESRSQAWIEAHPDIDSKKAAAAFIRATSHISQENFENALAESVQQFNSWLKTMPSQKYALYIGDEKKSNRWVAELAMKHLEVLPVLVIKDREFTFRTDKMLQDEEIETIAIFDDGIYSGRQISEHLMRLILPKRSIAAIVPFVSDPKNVFDPSAGEGFVHLFWAQKMHRLEELMDPETLSQFAKMYFQGNTLKAGSKIPVYFDFKIPDFVSGFPSIYANCAPPGSSPYQLSHVRFSSMPCLLDEIHPPYKQRSR